MEQVTNSLSKEIEAMAAIGRALGELTDPATRQRVMRWAAERYACDPVVQPTQVPALVQQPVAAVEDADLAVDNLTEMFQSQPLDTDDTLTIVEEEPKAPARPQPIESVLKSFAADFQRFADEWNGAAA